ncbi:MAG: FAD-dependent oxidoreductase [Candidatus Aceula meridiana]|nr:FAD-dependent oxidoreductase [Candidatus Aceula meridiana]
MGKIVLIGNTQLVVEAIEEIRFHDRESEITLFCPEGILPYDASRLNAFLEKEISEDELSYKPFDFYTQENVNLVLDKKIIKVYTKRKRVVTAEKEQIPFDVLILEDKGTIRFADIKGTQKKGVFHLKTFADVKDFVESFSLVDVIAVEADSLSLVKAACALQAANKEVILVSSTNYLLPKSLDRHTAQALSEFLEEKGIRLVMNSSIVEVLGDAEVKAIRLKNGKVLESQIVVLAGAYRDLTLFEKQEDMPIESAPTHTKIGEMFLFEELKESDSAEKGDDFEDILLNSNEHGRVVGAAAIGQVRDFKRPLREVSLKVFDAALFLAGQTKQQGGCIEYLKSDASTKTYKKVFVKDNLVVGAALINCVQQQDEFKRYIEERIDIRSLSNHILEGSQNSNVEHVSQEQSRESFESQAFCPSSESLTGDSKQSQEGNPSHPGINPEAANT